VTAQPLRVATRRSALARTQAQQVADALSRATGRPTELVPLATTGDEHPDRAVESFDAKGLFVDRVREAVLEGRADLVVHSHKDLPTERARGLLIGAVPEREDPRDLLVTRDGARLAGLRRGATIGTSSARRRAQLQRVRRDVLVQPLRGNLDTRLRRVADGALDAVVVAAAGVARLGPVDLPLKVVALEHGECLHAPAQGALAVECRDDDAETLAALRTIDHPETRTLVRAERAFLARLEGGCTAPVGAHAHAVRDGERIELLGMLSDPGGTHLLRASHEAAWTRPEVLGDALASTLLERGGAEVLERLRARNGQVPMGGP
jgi:hydroxymethylbilane synthase